MKFFSLVTLAALLSITACSHHKKCHDGSCDKDKKECCKGDHCKKPEAKKDMKKETKTEVQKTKKK